MFDDSDFPPVERCGAVGLGHRGGQLCYLSEPHHGSLWVHFHSFGLTTLIHILTMNDKWLGQGQRLWKGTDWAFTCCKPLNDFHQTCFVKSHWYISPFLIRYRVPGQPSFGYLWGVHCSLGCLQCECLQPPLTCHWSSQKCLRHLKNSAK